MTNILAIVGDSGVGKSLAASILKEFGCYVIVSRTTRPMREGEVNGYDHWFMRSKPQKSVILGVYGGYDYWIEDDDIHDGCNVYVIDAKSLLKLKVKFPTRAIYIKRDNSGIDKARTDRDKKILRLDETYYDYVLDNNGTIEQLREKLLAIWNIEKGRQ